MAPISVSDIYSKEVEEKNFRRIDNKETEGMIHLDGKKISTVGDATYSTFTAVPEGKLNEALLIRTNRTMVCLSFMLICRVNGKVQMDLFPIVGFFQVYVFCKCDN